MILAGVAVLSLGLAWLLDAWRRVEGRVLRWQLYALRDRVRMMAIEKKISAESMVFRRLDYSLSLFCEQGRNFSFWNMLPLLLLGVTKADDHGRREFSRAMARPENRELNACYTEAARAITMYLIKRHIILIVLLAPTVVGVFALIKGMNRIASDAASGSIKPTAPIHYGAKAAA